MTLVPFSCEQNHRLPKTKALRFQHVVDQLLCAAYQSDALDA